MFVRILVEKNHHIWPQKVTDSANEIRSTQLEVDFFVMLFTDKESAAAIKLFWILNNAAIKIHTISQYFY